MSEVEEYFEDVALKNGVITAKSPKATDELSVWATDASYEDVVKFARKNTGGSVLDWGESNIVSNSDFSTEAMRQRRKYVEEKLKENNEESVRTIVSYGGNYYFCNIDKDNNIIISHDLPQTKEINQRIKQLEDEWIDTGTTHIRQDMLEIGHADGTDVDNMLSFIGGGNQENNRLGSRRTSEQSVDNSKFSNGSSRISHETKEDIDRRYVQASNEGDGHTMSEIEEQVIHKGMPNTVVTEETEVQPSSTSGSTTSDAPMDLSSVSGANLLKDVYLAKQKGVNLLDASEKVADRSLCYP